MLKMGKKITSLFHLPLVRALGRNPLLIIFLAFLARVLYFLLITGINSPPMEDGPEYDRIALNLLRNHEFSIFPGYPTSFRPPLYPFFLSVIYLFFGHSYALVRIIQALLSSLSCFFLYLITRRVWNERAAILSGWLLALYPGSIYLSGRFLAETLFVLLFLSSIYTILHSQKSIGILLGGGLLGLSILTRSNFILFLPFLFLWLLLTHRRRAFVRRGSFILLGLILVISPWTIRNYRIHHKFVLISTNGGATFFVGNNRSSEGGHLPGTWEEALGFKPDFVMLPSNFPMWRNLSETESERTFYSLAFSWIREDPGRFLGLLPLKFKRTWSPFTTSRVSTARKYRDLFALIFSLLLILAVFGFILSLRKWRLLFLIYSPIITVTLTSLIFYGSTRMRSPSDPFLLIFSALGVERLIERLKRGGQEGGGKRVGARAFFLMPLC